MSIRRLTRHFYTLYKGIKYIGGFSVSNFPNTGGTDTFSICSTSAWEMMSKPEWIAMDVTSGGAGVTVVNITADTNPTTTIRAGEIRIKTKNGWGQEIVANCRVEANTAWVTVDGSSESPQFKTIGWDVRSAQFEISSNGGWKSVPGSGSYVSINPTGTTASTTTTATASTTQNNTTYAQRTRPIDIIASGDTEQVITIGLIQEAKPIVCGSTVGEFIGTYLGSNIFALPYDGTQGTMSLSANSKINIIGNSPASDYISMETPVTGFSNTAITARDVSFTATSLNSGQCISSAYTYVLSAVTENSGSTTSTTLAFNYEPFPFIPEASAITVSSADTSGVTSALSNYWLDVIDVKQYPNLSGKSIIDKPYSAWTSGNVQYNVNTGATIWYINNALSPSGNPETYGAEFFNSGYVFYDFNIGEIEQNIPLVKFDCTTQGCFRGWGADSNNVIVKYCLCSGTTPIGDEIRLTGFSTGMRYYNVITGLCSVAAGVPDIRLRINCVCQQWVSPSVDPDPYRFGFFGATLGINCYGTPPVSSNRLSAWTVHYANNVPLKPSILNYEFKTGPGESDELYDIEVVAHSARTMNNNTVLEMLGSDVSGTVLTIARGAYGIRKYLSLSAASPNILYTGNTEIAAYFDDGETGIITNVTSASTWSVVTGGEYGGIYTGGTPSAVRYFVSGNNYDNVNHAVGFKAVYEKDQKSYEAGGSVIVNSSTQEYTYLFHLNANPDEIDHDGTSTITAWYDRYLGDVRVDGEQVPASNVSWSITYGGNYATTAISNDVLVVNGDNGDAAEHRVTVRGDWQNNTNDVDIWVDGTGSTPSSYLVKFIITNGRGNIEYTSTNPSHTGDSRSNIEEWPVGYFDAGDVIDWVASKTGYYDESDTYTVIAGTNEIQITFDNPIPPCFDVNTTAGTISHSGRAEFTATYYEHCGVSAGQDVANSCDWYDDPSGYGTISNGIFDANNTTSSDVDIDVYAVYNGVTSNTKTITVKKSPTPPVQTYTVTFNKIGNYVYNSLSYTAGTRNETRSNYSQTTWAITGIPENTTFTWEADKNWYSSTGDSFTVTADTTIDLYDPSSFVVQLTGNTNWTGSSTTSVVVAMATSLWATASFTATHGYNESEDSVDFGVVSSPSTVCSIRLDTIPDPGNCTVKIEGASTIYNGSASSMGTVTTTAENIINGCVFTFTWQ